MTTWRELLLLAMVDHDEEPSMLESITLTDEELDVKFDDGYGVSRGKPFTAWTANRVYFPATYDGAEWVASVPRNPNGQATEHIGGE